MNDFYVTTKIQTRLHLRYDLMNTLYATESLHVTQLALALRLLSPHG